MIAQKSALIVISKILDGIFGYIGLFFITKYMSPYDYGIIGFAIGFVSLYSIFSSLGFNAAHIKKVSEGKDFGTCNGTFLTIKAILLTISTGTLLFSLFFWKVILKRGFETPEHELAIYIIIIYWLFNLLIGFFLNTLIAKKEIAKVQIPFLIGSLVKASATIYVAIAGYGAIALAYTYVLGHFAHLLLLIIVFRGNPINKPSVTYLKDYTRFAIPLARVKACSVIITNVDKVLIQLFWSATDVGYYFSGFRITSFIGMFTAALGMLLLPTFSKFHTNNDFKSLKDLLLKSERYLSMIVFPMVFGVIVLAEPATFILLQGWMPAVPILQILAFYALFNALDQPYTSKFVGMNKPKIPRNRVIIIFIINLILNIILIPKDIQSLGINMAGLGARGAAIATIISYFIGLLYSRIMSWKLLKIFANKRIVFHIVAATIMAVILYIFLYKYNFIIYIVRWYSLIGISLAGLIIYFGILILFKEFTREDFNFFVKNINIIDMLKYIRNELKGK